MAKITLDRENCIGCGACTGVCPDYFEMGTDGKSSLKGAGEGSTQSIEVDDAGCATEAGDACPVNVIKVE